MGKKTKRSRKGGGGSCSVVSDDVVVDGGHHQPNQKHQQQQQQQQQHQLVREDDPTEDSRRLPPALRAGTTTKNNETEKSDTNLNEVRMCEGGAAAEDYPFEDIYEEEEDDSYEDVYESSGDEEEDDNDDGEYEESMHLENDDTTGEGNDVPIQTSKKKRLPPINMNDGSNPPPAKIKTWNPFLGRSSSNDDGNSGAELEMDETAYKMHHALTPEWPSLTLDIIPDKHFGEHRTRFPHVVTMVVGSSQSENPTKNKVDVLRMSDLCRMPGSGREKTEKELDDEMLGEEWKHEEEEEEEEEESDDEEEEEEELDPILEHYSFPHPTGGVNRVRVCLQNTDIVAVWSDGGVVSLYDIGGALDLLDRSSLQAVNKRKSSAGGSTMGGGGVADGGSAATAIIGQHVRKMRKEPFFVYSGHSTEGYAMDWSRVTPGRLATADCDGNIHIWNATHPVVANTSVNDDTTVGKKHHGGSKHSSSPWGNSSFTVTPTYSAHGDNIDNPSVEDIQWSPTEATVLATAECGGYVRIYDIRCPGRAMISNKVHASGADVNVISWNRLVGNLLASGGDDGTLFVLVRYTACNLVVKIILLRGNIV